MNCHILEYSSLIYRSDTELSNSLASEFFLSDVQVDIELSYSGIFLCCIGLQ